MEILRQSSGASGRPRAPQRRPDEAARTAAGPEAGRPMPGGPPAYGRLSPSARRQAALVDGMADDLRAPLNSILMLAKLLADNQAGNLTAQQVDFAQTIYAASTDMLSLVEDALDLARMEADGAPAELAEQPFREQRGFLLRAFRQLVRERRIGFDVALSPELPAALRTDGRRLRYILKNLLSMAFRNARAGRVTLAVAAAGPLAAFEVRHRAEGSIGCRHATRLHLSICRELAQSLGGDVRVAEGGDEVRFVLELPLDPAPAARAPAAPFEAAEQMSRSGSGRHADAAIMLIVEGNAQVAAVMLDLVRASGYQGVVATDLGTLGVLLKEVAPEAVLIGGSLTDVDGWSTLEMLKHDPQTRGVPIGMSYGEAGSYLCVHIGARAGCGDAERLLAALDEAAGGRARRLLLAGLPEGLLLGCADARETARAQDAAEALALLRQGGFDAVVAGPELRGMAPVGFLRAAGASAPPGRDLPVAALDGPAAAPLAGSMEIAVLRRRARLEEVLGETALYLGRSVGRRAPAMPPPRREAAPELEGRKALVIDDDMYNVYAMTGALEQHGMTVVLAEDGRAGLAALREHPDVAVVLIDVTMPGMDAEGIVHALRATHEAPLPVVAVTARAMPGDRAKCLSAGASDYLAKPVNVAHMVALLKTWLGRTP